MKAHVPKRTRLSKRLFANRNSAADGTVSQRELLRNAAVGTRSGLRRYPKEILASLGSNRNGRGRVEPLADLRHFDTHDLAAVWIGHATILLRIGGLNVLTDPVFSHRIGMKVGPVTLGLSRLQPPAVDVEHLPSIDVILLSHAHFDHLDKPSLKRLARHAAKGATVITAGRTRRLIPSGFGDVIELDWGKRAKVGHLDIYAERPVHWGAHTGVDRRRGYNAYVLNSPEWRALFAGDTAQTEAFARIGHVDLAMFGIGAYEPWECAHANPEQVWRMFEPMAGNAGVLMPMHHSTFDLGEEGQDEPMRRLLAAAGDQACRVVGREPGMLWKAHKRST